MKENKYDNKTFFEQYSNMPRSKEGLSAAGEWHELKKLLPNLKDKRVLDLGCGFGWHCIYAAQQGAKTVLGVDISKNMLEKAKKQTDFSNVKYMELPIEDIAFDTNSFDVIISSLAFHYIENFSDIVTKVANCLASGGDFVFSAEHPVFTAFGTQDWYYNEANEPIHFPVDNYFIEGSRNAVFLGEQVVKYHKTLTTYINTLISHGFEIKAVTEPMPSQEMLDLIPEMKDELRRPMMIIIAARKK